MCGIAGWIGDVDGHGLVDALVGALRHRGPDGEGSKTWPRAGLVHTRLSILDLSPAGAEPIGNEDGSVWVVFNGEIYNHRQLRARLTELGHAIRGHSDAAVIPHLFEEYGAAFVTHLRGMFAIAVFDVRSQTLVLARDRFGIKPLFYARLDNAMAFASEINAIRRFRGVDTTPDAQSIADFTGLLWIPAPATFFTGVKALAPGEVLSSCWRGGRLDWSVRAYHRWAVEPDRGLTLSTAVERAESLIAKAVESQLESDVPLGALLSGGIDSSLVSYAAQAAMRRQRLQTFNVRFPREDFDETWAAVAVAERIGSEHRTLAMQPSDGSWAVVTSLLDHVGQPFADTSIFAVGAVSRVMSRYVTVVLSGDGGDEGFGGYSHHWKLALAPLLQRVPAALQALVTRGGLALGTALPWARRLADAARRYAHADDVEILHRMVAFSEPEDQQALTRGLRVEPLRRLFEPRWEHRLARDAARAERLFALAREIDFRLVLPNDYLFKVDSASMREGLEVRVPMLDEDLVDFALTLPARLCVRGTTCKRVLRRIAARRISARIGRKPKLGFGVPFDVWVDADFGAHLREAVLSPSAVLRDVLDPAVYRPWVEEFCGRKEPLGRGRKRLFLRMVMLLALQRALSGAA